MHTFDEALYVLVVDSVIHLGLCEPFFLAFLLELGVWESLGGRLADRTNAVQRQL